MSAEPLFALLEVMLNLATPKVTPGGFAEDMFVDVTDEEREELCCSICYQLLKDARLCINKHRFCHSCIFVWSTSGPSSNHGRCPVCRVEGVYLRNKDLDDKVQEKSVKCSMKSCNWVGPLKELGSHKHTTYNKFKNHFKKSNENKENSELPKINSGSLTKRNNSNRVGNGSQHPPTSRLRYTLRTQRGARAENVQRFNTGNSNTVPPSGSNSSTRSSPLRQSSSTSTTPKTPRPPAAPRPAGLMNRRRPTLPGIGNNPAPNAQGVPSASAVETRSSTSDSGDSSTNSSVTSLTGYGNIGTRLRQSRNRLDSLMTVFTSELERGRREIVDFQEEREVRRQSQLDEIRDLGQRLGQVATELRRLLDHRRQIRNQLDELADR